MSDAATLARMIDTAMRVIVFTGAGISTESGIPDFRSPGGVWSKMTPIYFEDFVSSRDARRESWARVFNRSAGWVGATPNEGHFAVAKLVAAGKATSVITQNVDNLHQDSGVPDELVIELHGNATYARCLTCGKRYEIDALKPRWEAGEDLTCLFCTGLIKTATISFGQPMPEYKMALAAEEALLCDLCLVLGSSLVVFPAAGIPLEAKRNGARLAIVNREPTDQDPYADLVLNTEIGPLMSDVLGRLSN
ncbi:SIR2 family NAD-dependent protein deacylase [Hyphomonas johnsonii]|uniref:protein acetyllysine N-acetyltransferase n=1 Tax=Hyphomonas johnsonii MHS-2 TaxID=1280950 RepID=A0A059FFQ4_9PROT|nr:Sir2 family NAD-dependent protein deacetylase [Hyphomonas johnsonii]KCZ89449.1 Sir2 family transcriptional regulator [Hyphomonas johnsonii MHS-2]